MEVTACQMLLRATLPPAGVQVADLVQADITGCLTMADGVCPMLQETAVQVADPQTHLPQPLQRQPQQRLRVNLRLLQRQPRLKPALLRHLQANPSLPLPIPNF